MRPFKVFALVALAFAGPAQAQEVDSVEIALIRKIIKTTNMGDQMIQSIEANVPAQRAANPRIPAVFWNRFLERARTRREELLDQMVPIYASLFTVQELELLLQFWQSPIGQRFVELQPRLTQGIMEVAHAWGAQLGAEIASELAREGVEISP